MFIKSEYYDHSLIDIQVALKGKLGFLLKCLIKTVQTFFKIFA